MIKVICNRYHTAHIYVGHDQINDCVTHLLTLLYKCLQSSQALPGSNSEHNTLWNLFLKTMVPYMSIIENWIFDGILNDENDEFMLKR